MVKVIKAVKFAFGIGEVLYRPWAKYHQI